jgi:formyltetrahydrofolate synthetase
MRGPFKRGRRVAASLFYVVFISIGCVVTLAATACRQSVDSSQGISIYEEITPQPVRAGEATVAVRLADATAKPVSNATIMVEADMDHPGMGPVFKAANETTPGRYEARINLNMGGDWVVLLHIELANGRKIERQMDVRGVRSN